MRSQAKNPYVVHVPEARGGHTAQRDHWENFYAAWSLVEGWHTAAAADLWDRSALYRHGAEGAQPVSAKEKSYRPIESCPGHEEHQACSFGVAGRVSGGHGLSKQARFALGTTEMGYLSKSELIRTRKL